MEAGAEHQGARVLSDAAAPRAVGIDLGTTNSAVAWSGARGPIQVFDIPQLVAAGEIGRQATLPSFLYFPTDEEIAAGLVPAPWSPAPDPVAGVFARDHGSLVPSRQIASAKSWLSNAAVDRSAAILPWIDEAPRRLSPVDASARLIAHLRSAWDHEHADRGESLRMDRQAVVLTVPASFDEEARELTVQAARDAGLLSVTLLEEPLAALYACIAAHPRDLAATLGADALVLVCDVGGGTTDFSLIRTTLEDGALVFERVAIGEHLLLGGDNLDFALGALAESRLPGGATRLSLSQRQILRRKCSAAKEHLLAHDGPARVPLTLLGGGRGVVGGGLTTELTRDDVVRALCDGFLPVTDADDLPARSRRPGLRELGLPFESEPAITRHLAAFLTRAATDHGGMAQPDAVLFNGGFFAPAIARARVVEALTAWSGRSPQVLENANPEASVAIGAAFYGRLRQDPSGARRLLIRAGASRSYYIGVAGEGEVTTAVCVMPRGTQEGTRVALERELTVVANQPSAFTLYSAMSRADPIDAVVTFEDLEDVHRHAPLVTALRYGKRSKRVPIAVRLAAAYTETGTLELWCESVATEHRWRLAFNLRGADTDIFASDDNGAEENNGEDAPRVIVGEALLAGAQALVRGVFGSSAGDDPGALTAAIEGALGHGKASWPIGALRALADVLIETAGGRGRSPAHEARWLNLTGFCARPGFGAPADDWRVTEIRTVYAAGLLHPRDIQCQVEWIVLWQRVAGGFTAGQQRELAQRVAAQISMGQKKPARVHAQIDREAWRLLASLERLDAAYRVRLGDDLAARVQREPRHAGRMWALGRIGARVPVYGPLNTVVPAEAAARWIEQVLSLKIVTTEAAAAVVQMGALTADSARDVPDAVRRHALDRLAGEVPASELAPLEVVIPAGRRIVVDASGERLPEGLRLVATPKGSA